MLAFQFCNRWLMGDTQRHLLSFGCHVAWYVTATLLQRGCQEMDIKRVGAQKKGAGVETGVRWRRRRGNYRPTGFQP